MPGLILLLIVCIYTIYIWTVQCYYNTHSGQKNEIIANHKVIVSGIFFWSVLFSIKKLPKMSIFHASLNYIFCRIFAHCTHSSEIRGLRSTKCSIEKLQNLLYFMYKKTHVVFFVFQFVQLYIFTLWMPWSMTWVFLYIKYSKYWSVWLEHFLERKPLISEECSRSNKKH